MVSEEFSDIFIFSFKLFMPTFFFLVEDDSVNTALWSTRVFFWRPEALLIKTMNHGQEDVVLFFCQPHTMLSVVSHPSLGHRTHALKTHTFEDSLVALVAIMCWLWEQSCSYLPFQT